MWFLSDEKIDYINKKLRTINYYKIFNIGIQISTLVVFLSVSMRLQRWEVDYNKVRSHLSDNTKIIRRNSQALYQLNQNTK